MLTISTSVVPVPVLERDCGGFATIYATWISNSTSVEEHDLLSSQEKLLQRVRDRITSELEDPSLHLFRELS